MFLLLAITTIVLPLCLAALAVLRESLGRVSAAAKVGPLLKAGANPRYMQGYAIGR